MDPLAILTPEQREHLRAQARDVRERARQQLAAAATRRQATQDKLSVSEVSLDMSERTLASIRASVSEFASLLRHLNTPHEQAIIEVKAVVRDALGTNGHAVETMTSEAVVWAVHAYYVA